MSCDPDSLRQAAEELRSARDVVVFTGAGASAESGIPTFRDVEGLWTRFPPEEFATWGGLLRSAVTHPDRLAEFLYVVFQPIAAAEPNAGHRAIADVEKHTRVTVVTQNIDNLHQDAGSTVVREVHGSLFEIVTRKGKFVRRVSRAEMREMVASLDQARHGRFALPRVLLAMRRYLGIDVRGLHRPNVVLFGDAMAEPAWSQAMDACQTCDCLIQVGCSGVVMPAAMLPYEATCRGASVISIDPQECPGDLWLEGPAATVLPALVQAAFGPNG